jgi:hypothetical protein
MDTSTTIQKATIEAEKQRYHQEGCCYECSKQGHLVRNCPDRKPCIKASSSTTVEQNNIPPPQYEKLDEGNALTDYMLKLNDKQRDIFIKKLMGENTTEDFQEA